MPDDRAILPSNIQRSISESDEVLQWQVSDENVLLFAQTLEEFQVHVFRHPDEETVLVIAHTVPGSKPSDEGDARYTGTSVGLLPGDCVIVKRDTDAPAFGVVRVPDRDRRNYN